MYSSGTGGSVIKNSFYAVTETDPVLPAFSLYPNPTTGKLVFDCHQSRIRKIEIYNTLGEKIPVFFDCHPDSYREQTVDCSALPPGIYIIQAFGEGKLWRAKVVKE